MRFGPLLDRLGSASLFWRPGTVARALNDTMPLCCRMSRSASKTVWRHCVNKVPLWLCSRSALRAMARSLRDTAFLLEQHFVFLKAPKLEVGNVGNKRLVLVFVGQTVANPKERDRSAIELCRMPRKEKPKVAEVNNGKDRGREAFRGPRKNSNSKNSKILLLLGFSKPWIRFEGSGVDSAS